MVAITLVEREGSRAGGVGREGGRREGGGGRGEGLVVIALCGGSWKRRTNG